MSVGYGKLNSLSFSTGRAGFSFQACLYLFHGSYNTGQTLDFLNKVHLWHHEGCGTLHKASVLQGCADSHRWKISYILSDGSQHMSSLQWTPLEVCNCKTQGAGGKKQEAKSQTFCFLYLVSCILFLASCFLPLASYFLPLALRPLIKDLFILIFETALNFIR